MTTIDRIMSKIENLIYDTKYNDVRNILEAELTVKWVDEVIEKYSKKRDELIKWIVYEEVVQDLKSLKQTPVASKECCCDEEWMCKMHWDRLKDSQPKEVLLWEDVPYKEDLWCKIYGYVNDWKVNITRVEYTGTRGIG